MESALRAIRGQHERLAIRGHRGHGHDVPRQFPRRGRYRLADRSVQPGERPLRHRMHEARHAAAAGANGLGADARPCTLDDDAQGFQGGCLRLPHAAVGIRLQIDAGAVRREAVDAHRAPLCGAETRGQLRNVHALQRAVAAPCDRGGAQVGFHDPHTGDWGYVGTVLVPPGSHLAPGLGDRRTRTRCPATNRRCAPRCRAGCLRDRRWCRTWPGGPRSPTHGRVHRRDSPPRHARCRRSGVHGADSTPANFVGDGGRLSSRGTRLPPSASTATSRTLENRRA